VTAGGVRPYRPPESAATVVVSWEKGRPTLPWTVAANDAGDTRAPADGSERGLVDADG
jgi:hypothetical protein